MGSMMSRITQLELKVQYYAKEIIDKDKKISILEEKVKLLNRLKENPDSETEKVKELELKCESLLEQIKDMEDFLADYGMMWVGSAEDTAASGNVGDVYDELAEETDLWRPGTSLVGQTSSLHIDFDKIIKSIRELNVLAGEGEKKIQHTVNGARLRAQEPIPLTLYANGIFMFNGPFRSYQEPETQQCIRDLSDGYFPSELQKRYPDGIPFQISDKRDTVFKDARTDREFFPGTGHLLGGESKPSRLVPSNLDKSTSTNLEVNVTTSSDGKKLYESTQPPRPQLSVDQFLNKLPSSVLRDGKVIDVRSSVADSFKGDTSKVGVTVIETPIVQEIKDRLSSPRGTNRPLSASCSITTLRIKSESGEHTYIMKMRSNDTIADVRKHIDAQRKSQSSYDIVTTYPNKVLSDETATLEQCGLIPNAALLLRSRKK
ncbi:UBX domain-containing protein 11-like [Amphiura filiformis]|uniref:UBX domain-containing protein 11-like n=1 Tax=Amphiura filiformis TaxID=82378 RepID=UPI003B20D247